MNYQRVRWKDPQLELSGMHHASIVYCCVLGCERYEIVWLSESIEQPNMMISVMTAREVGWVDIGGKWYCSTCAEIVKQEPHLRMRLRQVRLEQQQAARHGSAQERVEFFEAEPEIVP